jgi:hypothetical protein
MTSDAPAIVIDSNILISSGISIEIKAPSAYPDRFSA